MTGGGLHLATLGGIWQAIVFGFAGVRARDGVLLLDPRLPRGWERLSLRLRFRGRRLGLQLTNDEIEVRTDGPIRVAPLGSTTAVVTAPVGRFARRGGQWVERMTT
ncbi:MAG: glycosyl hydrolase family 65 protein [Acidimicrobiales bacterium]